MFKGTKIWKHQEFIKKYMNQYPVIQLDFSEIGFQNLDWKLVEDQFVDIMQVALEPHQEHVSEGVFSHMIERTSKVTALKDISKSLKHHHAKNPRKNGAIILIDEYDSAVNKAYNNEDFRDEKAKRRFINSLQEYTSTLLESGLKSNVCVFCYFCVFVCVCVCVYVCMCVCVCVFVCFLDLLLDICSL